MLGTKEDTRIKVKCKYCGAINDKHHDQHTIKCKECEKVTAYIAPIPRRK